MSAYVWVIPVLMVFWPKLIKPKQSKLIETTILKSSRETADDSIADEELSHLVSNNEEKSYLKYTHEDNIINTSNETLFMIGKQKDKSVL